ncbi:MAG: hypothetical protein ACOVP4_03320 [Bacteriovoracaceae bacterium]|jgi:hypothetical protein
MVGFKRLLQRYGVMKKPVLKATNPRLGTAVIPLTNQDADLFYRFLTDKVHALHFEGSDDELKFMLDLVQKQRNLKIQRIQTTDGPKSRVLHIHLTGVKDQEIRRIIRLL